jgi:putative selenate reductase
MSDKFSIIPFRQLLQLTLNQIDNHRSFFGIPEELFFKPGTDNKLQSSIYGQKIETPIGVAAGPQTQLTQNIVAAWLTGARFIELKTVQTLDELEVSKPCIDMQDEGYNCEWSQELKIHQSFDQYLNAWIILHILKDKLNIGNKNDRGFIFNMSVGYDLAGIMNPNVQWFFDKMSDAGTELKKKIEEIKDIYPNVVSLNISSRISDNITLSTMHGCPPEEIEQIGEYLISEKKLHTYIKLNPTLLGKTKLKGIIKNSGFDMVVPDIAFEHDLKYNDAVQILKRLKKKAEEHNVEFGIKLTNTLESENHKNVFPPNEKMMYASGRVLHPISVNIARKLQNEFGGNLNISFSGGVDAFNISNTLSSGLYPVTVCSDLLKPGGYGRLAQYIENIRKGFSPLERNKESRKNFLSNLNDYADDVLIDKRYKKIRIEDKSIKTNRQLYSFDCIHAPCVDTCPANQGIPDYMYHTANGDFDKAFELIIKTNPFPNTTGMICDHICQTKCTRINYDDSLLIREIKRFVTEHASNTDSIPESNSQEITDKAFKAAIIGAGPAGLSAAKFLKEAGFDVDVYEKKNRPGGMVSSAIPVFRIEDSSIEKDVIRIEKSGVNIHYGTNINTELFNKIKNENDFVIIAAGAQKAKEPHLEGSDGEGVFNPLDLLYETRENTDFVLGKNVIVIGGGNTAMDVARTAKRLAGKNGSVKIVYRRTIKQMPADFDEILGAQNEGIEIIELTSPKKINLKNGKVVSLLCEKMKLGKKDSSGRAKPIPVTGSEFEIPADAIIPAFGQDVVLDFVDRNLIKTKQGSYETQIASVYIIGDSLRGGSTVIHAVGDGRKAAKEIIEKAVDFIPDLDNHIKKDISIRDIKIKKARRKYSKADYHATEANSNNFNIITKTLTVEQAIEEASRCLYCDEICDVCTTVCPNLALYPYVIEPVDLVAQKIICNNGDGEIADSGSFSVSQNNQILHLADWCNECGNCNTFCPSSGAPYKEKPHLYMNYQAFEASNNSYYFEFNNSAKILYKNNNKIYSLIKNNNEYIYEVNNCIIKLNLKDFSIIEYSINDNFEGEIDIKQAIEMSVILKGVRQLTDK